MTAKRLLIALILLVGLGIALPRVFSDRSASGTADPVRVTRNAEGKAAIDISGMPVQGADEARVAVIEFSDYECPYCARYATGVFPEVKDRFISTGRVRYVFANFPLPNHPNAEPLAAAAICAGQQDAYWKMHDQLFENRPESTEGILDLGRQMGLRMPPFEQCLGDIGPVRDRIEIDQQIARVFQVSGTPSFILGKIDADGRVVAEGIIVGAQPFAAFDKAITDLLNK